MYHLWSLRLTFLSLLFTSTVQTVVCPSQCACEHRRDSHVINCSDRNLTSLPFLCGFENDNSRRMVEFYANENGFRHILKNSFYHVRERLRHLEIVSNAYSVDLARFAFDGLVDSLQVLKLEPISDDINVLVDSFKKLTKLKVLHLVSTSDEFQTLTTRFSQPDLVEISLQKSDLKNISFGVFSNIGLKILNLNHNHLNDFPEELVRIIAKSLSVLYLSANEITNLGDSDIPIGCRLVYLDLSFNRISSLDEGVLERCVHLKYLNLSHNPSLVSLGSAVFDGLSGLHLDASHTSISGLDFVKPEVLVDLFVFGTNVQCSCDVQVGHYEALNRNLKGTCWVKQKIVYIQSNPLNCSQYRQRQKRYRFNSDTDRLSGETDKIFGWASSFLGGEEFTVAASDHELERDLREESQDAHWETPEEQTDGIYSDKGISVTEHADIFTAQISQAIATTDSQGVPDGIQTFETPDQSTDSYSLGSNHPSSDKSSSESSTIVTWSSYKPISANLKLSSQDSTSETSSDFHHVSQSILTTPEKDDHPVEPDSLTVKEVKLASASPYDIAQLRKDSPRAAIINEEETTPSLQELPAATPEVLTVTPLLTDTLKGENAAISEKPELTPEPIFRTKIYNPRETVEYALPSTSSLQPSVECVHHSDHSIQPSTTINVINQISSTVTYKRDFTYVIRHVNNLNPHFFPSPPSRSPPFPDRSHEHVSVYPSAATSPVQDDEVKSAAISPVQDDEVTSAAISPVQDDEVKSVDSVNHYPVFKPDKTYTFEECQVVMKDHLTKYRRHNQVELVASEEDNQSAEVIVWYLQFPVYMIACCIHACLLFAAFLKVDRGIKTKLFFVEMVDSTYDLVDSTYDLVDSTYDLVDSTYDLVYSDYDLVDSTYDLVDSNFDLVGRIYDLVDSNFDLVDSNYDLVDSTYDLVDSNYDLVDSTYDLGDNNYDLVEVPMTCGQ
ncbi:hypothetical protein Btru_047762 [Bulinus truncatus]|nr:hypothetical protein Btru_047762 [Bulinus truncatus]